MSKTIAIISWKGGVGKTTSAVHLSSYIQMQKRKKLRMQIEYCPQTARRRCYRYAGRKYGSWCTPETGSS